ncbi:leucine-rich repeat neuronal protein 2-like isoform X2 [Galleria mellonella]|uniref:Leucine-rich repeat neuronal protein 2-like isoform X2 n=1 Tax=Galleria mellonella TaxID=7137 RepID=A0ABM3MCP6_GALME|nr:leucine-rich repeat neuronal protein 2-like isoform X2 [Galleria mellonella]
MINITCVVVFAMLISFSASQVNDETEKMEMPSREVEELIPNLISEEDLGHNNLENNEPTWPLTVSLCKKCACDNEKVDCRDHNLLILEDDDLGGLISTNVVELDLSGNPIKALKRLPKLPIERLNLSRCDLSYLDGSPFLKLKNLEYLDLSYNQLPTSAITRMTLAGYLEDDFILPRRFPNIRSLSLAYNNIHSLQKDAFIFMTELQFLDLTGNPLVFIDQVTMAAITDLSKLKELRLSGCELESIPDGLLRRQRYLERLDLSSNKFTTVPTVLSETVNLLYLNLDGNLISSLTEKTALSNLSKLEELHFSGFTRLQSIGPGALGGLANLVSLYITDNPKLTNLDPNFLIWEENEEEKWPPIKQLYLNNNNISEISPDYVVNWGELVAANFSNNPYVCDCSNQWMVDVLVPMLRRIVKDDDNAMTCRKPPVLRSQAISYLHDISKQLECPSSVMMRTVNRPNTAIVLGIMIGIFVTFPMVFLIVLLWRRGFFLRCRKRMMRSDDKYEDEETDAF